MTDLTPEISRQIASSFVNDDATTQMESSNCRRRRWRKPTIRIPLLSHHRRLLLSWLFRHSTHMHSASIARIRHCWATRRFLTCKSMRNFFIRGRFVMKPESKVRGVSAEHGNVFTLKIGQELTKRRPKIHRCGTVWWTLIATLVPGMATTMFSYDVIQCEVGSSRLFAKENHAGLVQFLVCGGDNKW